MQGWIKIHRQILEWEWYSDINTTRLFMHLLLKANHKEKKYKGMILKPGTILTSRDLLALETGLSVQNIRTSIAKLKLTNELTIKSSTKGTEIQLVNYKKFQVLTNRMQEDQPTTNQQLTTNKKEKNNKEAYRNFNHLILNMEDYIKLNKTWTTEQIDRILDQIENYGGNKKYKSLYLTAKNWLAKEPKNINEDPLLTHIKKQLDANKKG